MRKYIQNALLIFVSTVFALVISEFGFRYYKYVYADHNTGGVVVTTYSKEPHNKGKWYEFSEGLKFEFQNEVAFNNWGFRFHEDYSAQKRDSEFRIAVFGDSYTENETNDFSWVTPFSEALKSNEELKKALDARNIVVANFSRSGSGVIHMSRELVKVGKLFKPDLVVFAFIDEDFRRIGKSRKKLKPYKTVDDLLTRYNFKCPQKAVPGALNFYACVSNSGISRSFFYNGNNEKEILKKDNLEKLKDYMKYHVFMKSRESIIWKEVKKHIQKIESGGSKEEYFKSFEEAVLYAKQVQKNLLFLHLPAFYEVINQSSEKASPKPFEYWPDFFNRRPDVPLISLKKYLPENASYKERSSWFMLPYDGHPSNKGALLYGQTSADLIARYLVSRKRKTKPDVVVTKKDIEFELARTKSAALENAEQAMAFLMQARRYYQRENYQAAYQSFSRVIALKTIIGQPGLVFFERAQVAAKLKRFNQALKDLNSAISMDSHESYYTSRVNIASELKRFKLVADDLEILKKEFADKPGVKEFVRSVEQRAH